jgi:hypothetical protein
MINGFLRKWRSFLTEGNLKDYTGTGQVTLYHYSRVDADTVILDPKYFLSNRNSFSRREYEKSQVPRTFFYVDTTHAERIVSSGNALYTTTVPSSEIYNLKKDPEGILEASKQPGAYFIDFNKVLNTIKEKYKGVFYDTGGFDVVAWFESIEVNKGEP